MTKTQEDLNAEFARRGWEMPLLRAGAPWSEAEDEDLKNALSRVEHVTKSAMKPIADFHHRSIGSIASRAKHLGLYNEVTESPPPPPPPLTSPHPCPDKPRLAVTSMPALRLRSALPGPPVLTRGMPTLADEEKRAIGPKPSAKWSLSTHAKTVACPACGAARNDACTRPDGGTKSCPGRLWALAAARRCDVKIELNVARPLLDISHEIISEACERPRFKFSSETGAWLAFAGETPAGEVPSAALDHAIECGLVFLVDEAGIPTWTLTGRGANVAWNGGRGHVHDASVGPSPAAKIPQIDATPAHEPPATQTVDSASVLRGAAVQAKADAFLARLEVAPSTPIALTVRLGEEPRTPGLRYHGPDPAYDPPQPPRRQWRRDEDEDEDNEDNEEFD